MLRPSLGTLVFVWGCAMVAAQQQDAACLNCLGFQNQCVLDCGRFAGAEYGPFDYSTCVLSCAVCDSACGATPPVQQQLTPLQACAATIQTADQTTPGFLTAQEFVHHVALLTATVCPALADTIGAQPSTEPPLPSNAYFDGWEWFESTFSGLKCTLCLGVWDPANTLQATNGDEATCCPAKESPSDGGIDLTTLTTQEQIVYCTQILQYSEIQCSQPELGCLNRCQQRRDTCYAEPRCDLSSVTTRAQPDSFVTCFNDCQVPMLECMRSCPSSSGTNGFLASSAAVTSIWLGILVALIPTGTIILA